MKMPLSSTLGNTSLASLSLLSPAGILLVSSQLHDRGRYSTRPRVERKRGWGSISRRRRRRRPDRPTKTARGVDCARRLGNLPHELCEPGRNERSLWGAGAGLGAVNSSSRPDGGLRPG